MKIEKEELKKQIRKWIRQGYIRPEDVKRLIAFRNNPSDDSWRTI